MKKTLVIVVIATAYAVASNAYFGWNLHAQSSTEIICDGILALLFAMAVMTLPERVK